MVAFTKFLLFAIGASAAVVQKRATVANVLSDLQTLNGNVNSLTTALQNYDGTIGGVVPIQQKVNTVLSNIKTATSDTTSISGTVSDADSSSIINYVKNTIQPSINNAVTALIAQKNKLVAAGAKTIVQNNITYLKGNTTALGNALVNKASTGTKASASSAFSAVISSLNKAQTAFA